MPQATPNGKHHRHPRAQRCSPSTGATGSSRTGRSGSRGGEILAVCGAGRVRRADGAETSTVIEAGGAHRHAGADQRPFPFPTPRCSRARWMRWPLDLYMIRAIAGGSDRTPREVFRFRPGRLHHAAEYRASTSVIDHYSERPQTHRRGPGGGGGGLPRGRAARANRRRCSPTSPIWTRCRSTRNGCPTTCGTSMSA